MTGQEEKVLKGTLDNLMKASATQTANLTLLIGIVGEMTERISALESARLMRPKLVGADGKRIN